MAVFCFSILLYWQTTGFDFVWDDARTHLYGNKNLRENKVGYFWKHSYEGLFVPVSYTAWYIIKQRAPKNNLFPPPAAFHKVNIFIHGINCMLLFFLLSLFFKKKIAFISSLIFCCHPIQAEAVCWISELRSLLCTLFFLSGLLLFAKKRKGETWPVYWLLIFLIGILAVLSKPVAIVYPVVLYAASILLHSDNYKKNFCLCSVMLILFLPFGFITSQAQPTALAEMNYTFLMHLLLPAFSICFYIVKIIFPVTYSASYGLIPQVVQQKVLILFICVVVVLFLAFIIIKQKKEKKILFGILLFLVPILPVSGMVPFYFQQFSTVADRFAYIPMLGVAFAAASFIEIISRSISSKIIFAIATVIVLIFCAINYNEQKKWKNEITLWEDVVAKDESQAASWDNLAVAYLENNRMESALKASNKSISLNPRRYKAHLNRGNALARMEKMDEAIAEFTASINLKNDYAVAYYNRSLTYFTLKNTQKAKEDFAKAESLGHRVNEDYRKALYNDR